jgi:hypothetical protein
MTGEQHMKRRVLIKLLETKGWYLKRKRWRTRYIYKWERNRGDSQTQGIERKLSTSDYQEARTIRQSNNKNWRKGYVKSVSYHYDTDREWLYGYVVGFL